MNLQSIEPYYIRVFIYRGQHNMIEKEKALQISIDYENDNSFENVKNKQNQSSLIKIKNDDVNVVVGQCQQFISTSQKNARELNFYQISTPEHENWEPMACHFRNIQYIPVNVRTPKTLQNCMDFVCQQYLPYYRSIFKDQSNRKKFQLFLYDRVRAIRCQLYVQAVFQPELSMKLVKLILFLQTSIGQQITLTGLDEFLRAQVRQKIESDQKLKSFYEQALQYTILSQKRERLASVLDIHSSRICQSPRLTSIMQKKLRIINNNYYTYLIELIKNKNIFSRLILWSQMRVMRQIIIQHYRKAKLNERASFICKVLGYQKMEGWINLSKAEDLAKLQKHKQQYDLEIKLWINQATLMQALERINQTDQIQQ